LILVRRSQLLPECLSDLLLYLPVVDLPAQNYFLIIFIFLKVLSEETKVDHKWYRSPALALLFRRLYFLVY
jgi:hypothetical protein